MKSYISDPTVALSNIPPVKQILESAETLKISLSFEDGQFGIYGYPDLIRDSSKVLACSTYWRFAQKLLHYIVFPHLLHSGFVKILHNVYKNMSMRRRMHIKYQDHLLSLDFSLSQAVGIEGKKTTFSRNNEIFQIQTS